MSEGGAPDAEEGDVEISDDEEAPAVAATPLAATPNAKVLPPPPPPLHPDPKQVPPPLLCIVCTTHSESKPSGVVSPCQRCLGTQKLTFLLLSSKAGNHWSSKSHQASSCV